MPTHESESVTLAKDILRGKDAKPDEMLELAKRLQAGRAFGYARRILERARAQKVGDPTLRLQITQHLALCTYNDPDLPVDFRLDRALDILEEAEDLRATTSQETLGLAGAIHKRKWEVDGQKQHLERSLSYYLQGYEQGVARDDGYTGINAAFVLDLLADQEEQETQQGGATSDIARSRREQAKEIRENVVSTLTPLSVEPGTTQLKENYWLLGTLAEAHFGLRQYGEARPYLAAAAALSKAGKVSGWQWETTARQLAAIARLQEEGVNPAAAPGGSVAAVKLEGSPAWEALRVFLGDDVAALHSVFIGKVGLALSGGGFRASLFHIGVLARLAELDMLRHVEVLSCVSGGSIIGAHYYLEVRKLLQEKTDAEITAQDYVDIVQRIAQEFLDGVQRNIRTRVGVNPWFNLKMLLRKDYSRTERVGELYETELFARIQDGGEKGPRYINDLLVQPKGELEDFTPKNDNWRRRAKVPILILNATTLNTGHNWQFTATWMGEPPVYIDTEIDANYRLRRMYYDEAPETYRRVRLGRAVASSSCVPGLFEPIALPNLYPNITVRLVDGGVHDNQGVASLLEQGCTVTLVSDASGQNGTQDNPGASAIGTLVNSNGILMQRVREAQYHDLSVRRRSSLLRGLMFVHLKKDIETQPVDWIDCEDPHDRGEDLPLTGYGIRKDIQRLLAVVRTDLDSFHDAEAFALMVSGYRMTEHEFDKCIASSIRDLPQPVQDRPNWRFLAIEKPMTQVSGVEAPHRELKRLLEASSGIPFKVWKLSPVARFLGIATAIVGVAALAGLGWLSAALWSSPLLTVGTVAAAAVLEAAGFAGVHLLIFDKMYLNEGRIDRVMGA